MTSVPKGTETKGQREQLGTGWEHCINHSRREPASGFAVPWSLPSLIVVVYIYILCAARVGGCRGATARVWLSGGGVRSAFLILWYSLVEED